MTKLSFPGDGGEFSLEYDPVRRTIKIRVPDGYKHRRSKVANTFLFHATFPRKHLDTDEVE